MSKSTNLIPQAAVGPNDTEVLAAIEKTLTTAMGSSFSDFSVGVRNADGVVYRKVILDGLDQLPGLSNRLRKLGFVEEMDEEGGMVDGYDATYRRK